MSSFRPARAAALLCFAAASFFASQGAFANPTLVVDAQSGEVISSEDATRPWNPASTTKMMTTYVALKALREGRIGWETAIPVSRLAASQPPSKLGLRPGSDITLGAALQVMLVKSANDLAVVVAEGVGGSLPNFIDMMNAEARRLGMRESHFLTPHGFHRPGQRTSARDLAILARALYTEFPDHRDLWSTGAVQVGKRIMKNTNGLIGRYPGAEGMKTGFVCASGFNLVGLASRGGRTLIAVVMGAASGAERSIKTAQLLDQGFGSWSSSGQTLASLASSGYDSAPDMRDEICRRGRGVILSDDFDSDGPLSIAQEHQRASESYNPVMDGILNRQSRGSSSVAMRGESGRITLGPRADFVPVQITLGRTAGSASAPIAANAIGARPATAIAARGKPTPTVAARRAPAAEAAEAPAETTAYASSAPPAPPAPVAASAAGGLASLFQLSSPTPSAPLSLQGDGALTPGAAAAIRPAASGRTAAAEPSKPASKPQAKKPAGKKVAAKKPGKAAAPNSVAPNSVAPKTAQ